MDSQEYLCLSPKLYPSSHHLVWIGVEYLNTVFDCRNIIKPADAARLVAEGKRFMGIMDCEEKNYCDWIFVNESFEETRPGTSASFSQVAQSSYSVDDALLKTLLEQNTKIMDKLEMLFDKQELLSSNQFQLLEMISALYKKFDDVLIMPNDCFTANEQPLSPHVSAPVANTTANPKPAPVPVQPLFPAVQVPEDSDSVWDTASESDEYFDKIDPTPDFQPIIPLPDEVEAAAKDLTKNVNPKESQAADSSLNMKIQSDGNSSAPAPNPAKSESVSGFGGGSWLKSLSLFNFMNIFNRNSNLSVTEGILKKAEKENESDSEEKDTLVPNENEPHFEPIAPPPNLVETKTGEEDELIEFCERSKLFRYDDKAKEWKERGVGDLKILSHPDKKSFRMYLRREKAHEVVLNQRIVSSFCPMPMCWTNAESWWWFGYNLPEESTKPVFERLSVHFKTKQVGKSFEKVVWQCTKRLRFNRVNSKDADYNEYEYDSHQCNYVVIQALRDAMSEIIYECSATLTVSKNNVSSYCCEGIIRLLVGKKPKKFFFKFSTIDTQAFYITEINEGIQMLLENDRLTISEVPEGEKKFIFKFPNKESSKFFLYQLKAMLQ